MARREREHYLQFCFDFMAHLLQELQPPNAMSTLARLGLRFTDLNLVKGYLPTGLLQAGLHAGARGRFMIFEERCAWSRIEGSAMVTSHLSKSAF